MLLLQQLQQQHQMVATTAALAEGTLAMCRSLSTAIMAQAQQVQQVIYFYSMNLMFFFKIKLFIPNFYLF
jgi:hypothetical protein